MRETREGFSIAKVGSILLLFACLGLVGGGMVRVFRDGADAPVGWIMLVSGFVLTFATVSQWARILPGVFGLAGVNAVVTVWSGHQINQPTVIVPRSVAVILAVVFFSAAVLSGRVALREFNAVHRFLLLAVFIFLLLGMIGNQFAIIAAIGVAVCLCVLWRLASSHSRA